MTVDYKFYKITNVNNEWTLKKYIECSDQKKKKVNNYQQNISQKY